MVPPHLPPTLSLPAPPPESPLLAPSQPVRRVHNTRANTQVKSKSKSNEPPKSQNDSKDVEMQEAKPSHPYVTRSKSKSNEAKRRRNLRPGSANKANGTKPTHVASQKVTNVNPTQTRKAT
ncbi:hypothetical protein QCA50_005434 [Cerrena zonata]|uniref:Uncharacterized protein n=1 Tax=Cerrena zonata TaxID=2478898 RepID=A0AAW0GLK2_9APHY